jgi:hypothetical protein
LERRRITDLIVLVRKLVEKSIDDDMTKLARAHIFELIESGKLESETEDPLSRLIKNPDRAMVRDFFASILVIDNAAFRAETAVVVRRILASEFWRTPLDRLVFAQELEDGGHKEAALLVRSSVFNQLALTSEWTQGHHEKAVKDAGTFDHRVKPDVYDRLETAEKNDAEDRHFLSSSPWAISYDDPLTFFEGRIYNAVYAAVKKDYEAWLKAAQSQTRRPLNLINMSNIDAHVAADHLFKRLDPRAQMDYPKTLGVHELVRFILMAEHSGNPAYRLRRQTALGTLLDINTPEARLALARLLLASSDPMFIEELFANTEQVDGILLAELEHLLHEEPSGHRSGTSLVYQQALAKLAATALPGDANSGRRLLILRSILDVQADFELADLSEGRHPLGDLLEDSGLPENSIRSTAREHLARRILWWSLDAILKWHAQTTLTSSTILSEQSSFDAVKQALGLEDFKPERLRSVWEKGRELHAPYYARVQEIADRRSTQAFLKGVRDQVTHLEADHLTYFSWAGGIGLLFGVAGWVAAYALSENTPNKGNRRQFLTGWWPKVLLWFLLALAAKENLNASPIAYTLPAVESMQLSELDESFVATRAARPQSTGINLWQVNSEQHLAVLDETLAAWSAAKPEGAQELFVVMVAEGDALRRALKQMAAKYPNVPMEIVTAGDDVSKALEVALENRSDYASALKARSSRVELYLTSSEWTYSKTIRLGSDEVLFSGFLSDDSIHWIDQHLGAAVIIPLERALEHEREARRNA